jgi:hypothetical protein
MQISHSSSEPKKPILIDSIFCNQTNFSFDSEPWATTQHPRLPANIQVPFNYSGLIRLEAKMLHQMDNFLDKLE